MRYVGANHYEDYSCEEIEELKRHHKWIEDENRKEWDDLISRIRANVRKKRIEKFLKNI